MKDFQVVSYELHTEKIPKGHTYTMAFLSDLHNKEYGKNNERLISTVRKNHPDYILCPGDMLVGHTQYSFEPAQHLMKELSGIAPVYVSNGNHESRMRLQRSIYKDRYETYYGPLIEAGVHVLVNETVMLNDFIKVSGFECPLDYYGKFGQTKFRDDDLTGTLGEHADKERYHILLAHNPVYFKNYAAWGADLTLSGHLHGGIIRLPLIGGVITPQFRLFPKYDRGLYSNDGHYLCVSPGLGTHTINIRFLNPAQLIFIQLTGEGV